MKLYISKYFALILLLLSPYVLAGESLQLKITGMSGPAVKNAEERLVLSLQSYGNDLSASEIQAFYQTAPKNITQALQPFGYFKATVSADRLIHQGHKWIAYFTISPGPVVSLTQVDVSLTGPGKNNAALRNLIANYPLKPGQIFQADQYEKAKDLLFQTANNQGYIHAILDKKEVQINLQNNTAIIQLKMNTGPRYYFGAISFSETPFSKTFLQRFLSFHEGDAFSSETLLKLQEDLSKSRYFENVVITPDLENIKNLTVPVHVDLTVPKAKQYNVGVGYGTFTGPRLTLGTDYRRVGDSGQHFTTQIKLSSVLSGLAAKYFIPGKNPLTDQYSLGADAQKFSPKNGQSFSEKFSASYMKTLSEWQHNITLNYLIERFQVNNNPSEVSRLLYPSYGLTRIKTDDLINPTRGSAITLNLQGASKNILSATNFAQAELKAKYIFSPTVMSRVIVRGDVGYTAVNDLSRLPLTLRFFAGGLGSVRGYDYSSIGPGRYLETASVELQHHVIGDFSGAVFYDVGTATNHFNDKLFRGEGAGVVYNSIVGPVQLYVARAMSKRGKPLTVEFSIGPSF
ncbi:MAG: autotransporter assembly complex family protein [Gammaproteobacteria bacterium]